MRVDDELVSYVFKNHNNDKKSILRTNRLFDKFGNLFEEFTSEDYVEINNNRKRSLAYKYELKKVCNLFVQSQIVFFIFKGAILSVLLYGNAMSRVSNDIDIYVDNDNYDKALLLLKKNGFKLKSRAELKNEHHAVMIKNSSIVLELHKKIYNPMINIDEIYLKSNLQLCDFYNQQIPTFNITATLLHLLYHFYMDIYPLVDYFIFYKKILETGRFLCRAYEIALFSEKYYKEIIWDDIQKDIKHQKLHVIFKKMILDILNAFPNAFPESFIHTILQKEYTVDKSRYMANYLLNTMDIIEEKVVNRVLCKYVDDNWNIRKERNIHKKIGESFKIAKNFASTKSQEELCCQIETKKLSDGIELTFSVSDDDLYISATYEYDTMTSDGVHLILCGTEEYSYNSIFLFPKAVSGEIKVVPCNVFNNANIVLDENLMRTAFVKNKEGYSITTFFSNKFIKDNHIDNYFYMGVVISDCSRIVKQRTREVILSEIGDEWYNPIYFAKIEI